MDEKEFNVRLQSIQNLIKSSDDLDSNIKIATTRCTKAVAELLTSSKTRDEMFLKYLNLQKEYGFSDNLATPSDLFPGIQTAIDMSDPEKLLKASEDMKQLAYNITAIQKNVNLEASTAINTLKNCLGQLSEYIIQKNQIYDLCMELLQDSDSIYDIGNLASNS